VLALGGFSGPPPWPCLPRPTHSSCQQQLRLRGLGCRSPLRQSNAVAPRSRRTRCPTRHWSCPAATGQLIRRFPAGGSIVVGCNSTWRSRRAVCEVRRRPAAQRHTVGQREQPAHYPSGIFFSGFGVTEAARAVPFGIGRSKPRRSRAAFQVSRPGRACLRPHTRAVGSNFACAGSAAGLLFASPTRWLHARGVHAAQQAAATAPPPGTPTGPW